MKVSRYFHVRNLDTLKGGCTIKVTGDTDNPAQVDVQYTKCSRKDSFIKSAGRAYADAAPIKVVQLRYLAQEMADISKRCGTYFEHEAYFLYALKYFLPKE